ncbi:hypothetical protein GCM10009641_46850 [Mycobacterium cookii]|uniref:Uncharacterized protein n=1 Tax=Nocardioides furvisabuli TaxID=375542 RepID=A0ABP5JHB5_9ACTN
MGRKGARKRFVEVNEQLNAHIHRGERDQAQALLRDLIAIVAKAKDSIAAKRMREVIEFHEERIARMTAPRASLVDFPALQGKRQKGARQTTQRDLHTVSLSIPPSRRPHDPLRHLPTTYPALCPYRLWGTARDGQATLIVALRVVHHGETDMFVPDEYGQPRPYRAHFKIPGAYWVRLPAHSVGPRPPLGRLITTRDGPTPHSHHP